MNRFLTKKKAKQPKPEPKFELDLTTALPSSNDFRTSLLMPNLSARFSMLREQDDPNSILGKASDDSVLAPKRQSRLYDFGFKPTGLSDIAEVASISSSIRPPFANERTNSFSSDVGYNTDGEVDGSVMSRSRPGEGNVLFGGRQKITRIGGDGSKGRTLYDDDVATSTFQKWRAEERQREREAAIAAGARKFSFEDEGKSPSKPGSYATSVAGSLKRQTSSSTATSGQDSRSSTAATSINSQGPPSASMSPAAGLASFNFGPSVTNATPNVAPAPAQATSTPQTAPISTSTMDRSATGKRRLYDQGLDREFQDQQASAASRMHSINKRPGMNGRTTPDIFQGRNVFAGAEKPLHNGLPPLKPSNPAPTPVSPLERMPVANGLPGKDVKIGRSNTGKMSPLPTSPVPTMNGEHQEVLASALNPNDRGKATAMGVFNKPRQFSEQQFVERQRTLQMGRDTPTPTLRENSIDAITESTKESAEDRKEKSSPPLPAAASIPPQMRSAVPSPAPSPMPIPASQQAVKPSPPSAWDQSRSLSNGPFNRSRSSSADEHRQPAVAPSAPSPFAVFQKAASQIKAQERKDSPQMPPRNKFAFIDDSDSEYEDEQPAPPVQPNRNTHLPPHSKIATDKPLVPPPQHEHPAFRNTPQPSREDLRLDVTKSIVDSTPAINEVKPVDADVDSPTLPSVTPNGLSGMIRHLRDTSATSVYSTMTTVTPPVAPMPAGLQTKNLNTYFAPGQNSAGEQNTAHSSYSHSNPWDLEDYKGEINNLAGRDSVSVLESEHSKEGRTGEVSPLKPTPKPEARQDPSWQHELSKKTHMREGSTETQHEREAFANELAMRQKAIQEKLRERAESDMRSASPNTGKPSGPFMGILRQKSSFDGFRSRENSRTRDESRPRAGSRPRADSRPRGESKNRAADKAARILGVNGSTASLVNSSPSLGSTQEHGGWDAERTHAPRSTPLPMPRPSKELQQAGYGQTSNSNPASRPGTGRDSSEDKVRSRSNSNAVSQRSRSNSEHSNGRSRSRNGRHPEDMSRSGAEATIPEDLPPQKPALEHPIPEVPESPTSGNGLRDYKPIDAASFEQKGLWPPPQNPIVHPFGVPSPRPSPGLSPGMAPNGSALSPGLNVPSPRPSPGLSPGFGPMSPSIFASGRSTPVAAFANPTPPLSSSSTPTGSSFSGSTPNLVANTGMKAARHRKMSIKKTDIGEPVLVSTTSVVDTVDLPPGASLRNGMDAPPVPPFNPRRKRFAFGRADTEPPEPPFASPMFGSGAHSSDESQKPRATRHRLKKSSSDGAKIGLYIRSQQEGMATQSTPALQHLQSSPPRMQNGMF